jgi:hypothetical protein
VGPFSYFPLAPNFLHPSFFPASSLSSSHLTLPLAVNVALRGRISTAFLLVIFLVTRNELTTRADEAHQGRVTLDYNQFVSSAVRSVEIFR